MHGRKALTSDKQIKAKVFLKHRQSGSHSDMHKGLDLSHVAIDKGQIRSAHKLLRAA